MGIWIIFSPQGVFRLSCDILQNAWWCTGTGLPGTSTSGIASEQAESKYLRLAAANPTLLPGLKTEEISVEGVMRGEDKHPPAWEGNVTAEITFQW